uniref:Band 7 domain-containing protein n=1 Tax=Chromera velia CCMP2878 TaxID=1169474 RepID=A0A0G4FJ36_9ALVE|eukprot:Cvel_17219.t1-p1 / transcript=Cvel_17219.t1 / gene=Cvel_17219 / organism=Chromera_velia_CCMP2878 / gene_product=Stomatin-like protein 2, mitochondrial, putative / transcript_product=Stomatin-like protein 2, mitochondrial, putative / location=Cvel_scaffold1362:40817-47027(-) / protein_length=460 / sequence_SO=supercontig / SO=protein_coding / is_pseudo=false
MLRNLVSPGSFLAGPAQQHLRSLRSSLSMHQNQMGGLSGVGTQNRGLSFLGGGGPRRSTRIDRHHPGFVVVAQQTAWVVERFGKFHKMLTPGLHFLIPFIDRIAYIHSLKEEALPIANQQAITKDNVAIQIDGVLYLRIEDPYQASYGVEDPIAAVTQLAQTTMRSELGKLNLDSTFQERESLNSKIVRSINEASGPWGISCLRYEIRDIVPPKSVRAAMEMQAEAERRKRAEILQSEGEKESQINLAMGRRESAILFAQGEAQGILERAKASADGISVLSRALLVPGGRDAVTMRVAEQYVNAFGRIAKETNTVVVPANAGDPAGMIAQALSVYRSVRPPAAPSGGGSGGFLSGGDDGGGGGYGGSGGGGLFGASEDLLGSGGSLPSETGVGLGGGDTGGVHSGGPGVGGSFAVGQDGGSGGGGPLSNPLSSSPHGPVQSFSMHGRSGVSGGDLSSSGL